MPEVTYLAGVCNIGPEEVARRRNIGWGGLVIALVLFGILAWTGVNPWWRVFIFFPAALSASGFLQAYFHFCTGFAQKGISNFGALGNSEKITDPTSHAKDKSKGNKITMYAALIGIVVTVLAIVI